MEDFEKQIGVIFKDKGLLKKAFTHRSYLNENRNLKIEHNERLEFLGDAVLELIVTKYLFNTFPEKQEGELTSYRASLVNAVTLSKVAESLGVNDFLLLSKGETKDTGRARQTILANTMEAIIGAIYLDQGFDAAEQFISKNVFVLLEDIVKRGAYVDGKSRFQEVAQEKAGITPSYKTLKEDGPDHDRHFTVGLFLDKTLITEGSGKSKQEAEEQAARKALELESWK